MSGTETPGGDREGMVTVRGHDQAYLGCMGTETWKWLLDHPEMDAPALDRLVARNQQLELQRDALLAALQEQPPPSDNVFRYFQRMHGLPEIGRPADPELADSLTRNQQLQEALERLLDEYDDEAREHGVPLNFALRDALRAARAALASVRARSET